MEVFNIFKPKEGKVDWNSTAQSILADAGLENEIEFQDRMNMSTDSYERGATWYGTEYPVYNTGFDGEKNQGELGAPLDYNPLYQSLSYRSWQAYLESDVAKILVNSFVDWVVGSGLKLQAEPDEEIINDSGVKFDKEKFVKQAESRFRLYMKSNESTFSQMDNAHAAARKAYKSAIIGGDVLAIFRYEDTGVNVDLYDGRCVSTPLFPKNLKKGHKIVYGVEINKRGTHVAYWILQDDGTHKRVAARGLKTGRLQAALIYGDEYRIGDVRGLPLYASSLEKMKKIDRYIEATVGAAEERAKVPYTIEHNHFSDGENPFISAMLDAKTAGEGTDPATKMYNAGSDAGKKVAMTTGKMPTNMPIGAQLKSLESTMETKMSEFVDGNFVYMCASLGIPYEVALMKFVNSFSASRMATQSWEHILLIKRQLFADKFYQPMYNIFLETEILKGNINARAYINSIVKKDVILRQAFTNARFVGPGVPQADPTKEVKAVVLMLQNNLITHEQATELLTGGDFIQNLQKLGVEYDKVKEYIPEEFIQPVNPEKDSAELGDEPESD